MICGATGKLRHVDEDAALAAQERLDYGDELEPYYCKHCGGHHLGARTTGRRRNQHDVWGADVPRPAVTRIGGTTIGERLNGGR